MPSFYALMGVEPSGFDPEHRFFTSWLLPPLGLAIYRLLFALLCWSSLIANWAWNAVYDPSDNGTEWSFFTTLTWWGITFYMSVASIHTFVYWKKGYTWLDRWMRPLQVLHSLFYTTVVVFPPIVTIVYWVVIYQDSWSPIAANAFRNVARHGLNSLAALLEIVLPTTNPPPWLHVPILVIILTCYLGVAYITHVTQGFYPYTFLDPENGAGLLAGYIVGIAIGCVVIFLIVWGLIWLRRRYTGNGKRSKNDIGVHRHMLEARSLEMSAK